MRVKSYTSNGFGLYIVETKPGGQPIGMCGLIKRPELDTPDLGFAFLREHCGNGYATEASEGVLNYEVESRALLRIMAITLPENNASNHVLRKCGFTFIGHVEVNNLKNNLYVYEKSR
ncbi:GNAT family N-acetyltransferase [Marinobacter sp.]|uniref:GNAT family N-acetyltransferase n=1 Tax=Marinobacter sp. TaxID=50741 RepID=UPI0035C74F56